LGIQIAAGHSHAAALTLTGEVFWWGMTLHLEPVLVMELLQTHIVDIACGQDYTLAVDEQGNMYSWGTGGKTGVLGHGGSIKSLHQATLMEAFHPTVSPLEEEDAQSDSADAAVESKDADDEPKRQRIVQVSAGWKHAACSLTVASDES
jgi:alpha-tubulin suppressor-like RCC1 family protein